MTDKNRRTRDLLPDFDFFSALIALLFGAGWGTDRMELKPIPVKVRRR
ncbi:MAG TPA: hypothetical protein VFE34_21460 [Dongiaceae bacterium]|jgi:hypothetical protein|nr:hypothetical protein [Dongiaceae bacterium]